MTKDFNIGIKIKKLREIKGFKQEFMAEKLDISQQSYSKIEGGKVDVPISKLEAIAEILGMKVEDILSFDEKYVLNHFGEHGNQIIHNSNHNFPLEMKQLYEDKILLLEDKIKYLEKIVKKYES